MLSTVLAIFVLALFVALIAWFSGPWRPARAVRGFADAGFSAVRRSAEAHGVTTGRFGVALDRWRVVAYVVIAVVASLVILFNRPVTTSLVVWTVVIALIAVALVELLRRPAAEVAAVAEGADGVDTADVPPGGPVGAEAVEAGESVAATPADPARRGT
jgi:hypothetical protein